MGKDLDDWLDTLADYDRYLDSLDEVDESNDAFWEEYDQYQNDRYFDE